MKHLILSVIALLLGFGNAKAQFKVFFTLPDTVSCGNLPIDLSGVMDGGPLVFTTNGTPPYTAQWLPATDVSDPTSLTPVLSPSVTTTYTIIVQDANGLKDTTYYRVQKVSHYSAHLIANVYDAGCTASKGSIEILTKRGVPDPHNLTYAWSNGFSAGGYQNNLNPATYTITATDANGCVGIITDSVTIGKLTFDMLGISNGSCTGSMYANLTSPATAPVEYWWNSIGQTTQVNHADSLPTGYYTLIVFDANGCTGEGAGHLQASGSLRIDSVVVEPAPCSTNTTSGCAYVSGGTPPYTYLWVNMGGTTSCFNGAGTSTADYRITDAAGCRMDTSFYIPSAHNLSMYLSPDTAFYTIPDSVVMNVVGGTPPFNYTWFPSNDTTTVYYPSSNDEWVLARVIDAMGCHAMDTIIINACASTCRWPGDANYDGIADNTDLLQIGLGYNSTGYADYFWADLMWAPHAIRNWNAVSIDSVNFKHADCNGDGTIDANDTTAILLNYGLQHPRSGGADEWRANIPALQPIVQQDTVIHNDTLIVDLILGDALNPASDVYAIAFTINYNPLVIDTTKTMIAFGDSWLGDATDKISISKDVPAAGKLHCALTRIDHANRNGQGPIGTVKYVITTDNINGKDLSYYSTDIWISDIKAIDNAGHEIEVNGGLDSSQIEYEITGINEIDWSSKINMYPNPANDILSISSLQLSINNVSIVNVLGEAVISTAVNGNKVTLSTEALLPGIYFTELQTDKGTFTKRLIITR